MFDTSDVWGRRNWGERMWVEVLAIRKRHIVGVLRSSPIGIPRLDFGDKVKFKRDHIIDILREFSQIYDCEHGAGDPEHQHTAPVHEGCNAYRGPGDPQLPSQPGALEGN
jgi:hypothetical protein